MELTGKVALVTGAKRIGAAVAAALAARGADVAITYHRSGLRADETVREIEATGRRAVAIQSDLGTRAGCEAAVEGTVARFGRLDVLVCLASIYTRVPFDELTPEIWHEQLAVDLDGTFHCAMAAVPHLRRAGGGRIITFADWVARSGRPRYRGYVPYYVAKSAVIGLTEALALELAGDGILVNAIAPGPILPPEGITEAEEEGVLRATPLGRWGGESEIAKAVLALVDSDFITGETVRVDGGRHLS